MSSEQGGHQHINLRSPLLLLLQTLTLTPLTYLLLLPILGSLSFTQHSTRSLHLPPALLLLFPLPLPLEHPSSMADRELHHLQLMHWLLEQQVHCLLPVSCLRPKEQVWAWKGFGLAPSFIFFMNTWVDGGELFLTGYYEVLIEFS